MAKALMVQGTASGVGKSVIVAGLCRIFRDLGIRTAPFKSQNMALNSFITREGGEIGRAQAFQAEAARIEPSIDMNPVLLKVASCSSCQVICNGKVYGNMKSGGYYSFKDEWWDVVRAAYDRLSNSYDLIVIEGAGSPAEINLRAEEIVNMRMARYAGAPVILVGDIERGGLFASLYGTVELLKEGFSGSNHSSGFTGVDGKCDADYIKAFIVNKFRGDINILRPGLRMIEEKTGRPVIGVIDYLGDLGLHEEDAIPLERCMPGHKRYHDRTLKIVVLVLNYISNFTDFDPFLYEPDVELKYSNNETDMRSADLIIIPGSKNTVSDLLFLRETGIDKSLRNAVRRGASLAGICGGYQMLGGRIYDPYAVESEMKEVNGLGLLDIETVLDRTKTTCQVTAVLSDGSELFKTGLEGTEDMTLNGYEIHMGNTTGDVGLFRLKRCTSGPILLTHDSEPVPDGSAKDNVWGTYIHGLFDNDGMRTALLNSLRIKKGLPVKEEMVSYHREKDKAIHRWAEYLRSKVDICYLLRQVGMDACMKNLK